MAWSCSQAYCLLGVAYNHSSLHLPSSNPVLTEYLQESHNLISALSEWITLPTTQESTGSFSSMGGERLLPKENVNLVTEVGLRPPGVL